MKNRNPLFIRIMKSFVYNQRATTVRTGQCDLHSLFTAVTGYSPFVFRRICLLTNTTSFSVRNIFSGQIWISEKRSEVGIWCSEEKHKHKYKYRYRYRYRRSGRKWGYDALRTLFPDDKRWIPGPKCSPVSQGKEKATIEGWIIVGWCVFHWPMGCSLILPGHCFSPNVQCIHSAQKDFLESDKSDTAGHLPNAVVFSLKWRNVLSQICTQLQWLESRSRSRSPVPGPQWLLPGPDG